VVLVDANVLVYAVNERARDHEIARAWLAAALGGGEGVGFAWFALIAFLRVITHPAALARPLAIERAGELLEVWLEAPPAVVVEPTRRHLALLRGLLERAGTGGNLTNDAHLAALALEHGATIVSFDRDFGRFAGVRSRVPG